MRNTSKTLALLLTLTIILSGLTLLTTKPANAQTVPSVPEFTAKLVIQSYDTPATTPTYTIDPYSGEQKQVYPGSPSYHVENKWIELAIKNQPFTPYNDSEGRQVSLYYNIRYKGHFGSDWSYDPFKPDGVSSKSYGGIDMTYLVPYTPSNSEYTKITYNLGTSGIPTYGELDFQVQTQIGYIQTSGNAYTQRVFGATYNFIGESSSWSPTQTVSTTETSDPSQTAIMSPTSSVPEYSWCAIVPLILSMLSAALIFRQRKTANKNP